MTIGKAGAKVTIARYGFGYWQSITARKGWQAPRAPELLADLAAGQALTDLDLAA